MALEILLEGIKMEEEELFVLMAVQAEVTKGEVNQEAGRQGVEGLRDHRHHPVAEHHHL